MRLKKIYISGFKSIADSLHLDFGRGVTCIVGPNGCGKSNVSDAVQWVLGDQNPRNMRANKMQDLIFSGTDTRKPEAMAEVRLLIDNEDGGLDLPYAEVEIGRRLYRSGESEYRINKEVVRLKDLVDLISNTGIGTTSYSLLGQGRVDAILNSKPSERRELFEEAAEITKYRMRQDEALRKLKRTDLDLQRLDDILGELERQVRSLKYQADKASRYNRFHTRLHDLELVRLDWQRSALDERLEKDRNDLQQAVEMKSSLELQVAQGEKELEAGRINVEGAREQLAEVESRRAGLQSEIRHYDDQLTHNRQMETELLGQEQRTKELESTLSSELQQVEERLETARTDGERLMRELADLETEESLLAVQEQEGHSEFEAARKTAEEATRIVAETQRAIESISVEMEGLERGLAGLCEREEKMRLEAQQAEEELSEIDSKFSAGQSVHEDTQAELHREEAARNQLRQTIQDLEKEIDRHRGENERLHLARSRVKHRLESLRELQTQYEGHGEGVKQALDRKAKQEAPFDRIQGLIIEETRVEPGYEDAVETALSAWFESVLCETKEDAIEILKALRESGGGRLSCLALDLFQSERAPFSVAGAEEPPEWTRIPGAVLANSIVTVSEAHRAVLEPLLQRTLVVSDLEDLSSLLGKLEKGWMAVTRAGEVAHHLGLVSGGKGVSTGFLRRQSEIVGIEKELAELNLAWDKSEQDLGRLREERKQFSERLREKEEITHNLVIRIAAKQEELQGLAQLRERIEANVQKTQDGLEWLAADREKISGEKVELERKRQEYEFELEQERESANHKLEEQRRIEEALNDLRSKHSRHRESLVALQKDHERCQAEIQQSSERRQSIESRIAGLRREDEERSRKIQECSLHKEQAEKALRELFEKVDAVEKDLSELEANLAREREKCAGIEEQVRQIQEMYAEQVERIRAVEMENHRTTLEKENLERRLTEELQSTWEACQKVAEEIEDVPGDLESLTAAVTDLRERIAKMGEVNPLALEEYEEQSERLRFLQEQKEDLERAKASLHRTISEVKRTARKQFLDVFEQIRQNFNQTFRKVFGGGRADLILLDEVDILTSGIEIVAQPPGKKLQSITLFSGGEKSMTAIALLFAVYRVKASPFCFLDEVDAALDDSNVDRFARLLTDFRQNSQFIIVTHNKHTMAAADRLYGVTMEKPGVSTVMSMEFETRAEYNLDPLPEPEEDILPERDYDAALREAEQSRAEEEEIDSTEVSETVEETPPSEVEERKDSPETSEAVNESPESENGEEEEDFEYVFVDDDRFSEDNDDLLEEDEDREGDREKLVEVE